jgi:hypothetical protein
MCDTDIFQDITDCNLAGYSINSSALGSSAILWNITDWNKLLVTVRLFGI